MTTRAPLLGALLVLLGGLAAAWIAGAFSSNASDETQALVHDEGAPPDAPSAGGLTSTPPAPASGSAPAPDGASKRTPAEAARLDATLRALRGNLAAEGGLKEEVRDAARRTLLRELRSQAKHVDGAWALLARLEREEDAATALRLGRALRNARHPEIGAALASRLTKSPSALVRCAAVAGLEMRPPAVWWEPVRSAYEQDADTDVRREAANLLGRSLQDRLQRERHADVRDLLRKGLGSEDADQRLRTLTAFMSDRNPTSADLDAIRPLLKDTDARVQREAAATLRVLERRAP